MSKLPGLASSMEIRQAILKDKLSAICATCERYWEAKAQNKEGLFCTSPNGCGGPLRGSHFPDYKGPITDFSRWCFVCGEDPTYGIRALNSSSQRVFGMCDQHPPSWAQSFRADTTVVLAASKRRGNSLLEITVPWKRKSLADYIQEYEAELANGR